MKNQILHVTEANAEVDRLDCDYNAKIPLYWNTNKGARRQTGWILRDFNTHGGEWHKTKGECYAAMFDQLPQR